jgi:hypothetical protein
VARMPDPTDPNDRQIWTEGFRHGYSGFVIRQSAGDPAYAAGYVAGQELRQAHRVEYERALFEGRRVRQGEAKS